MSSRVDNRLGRVEALMGEIEKAHSMIRMFRCNFSRIVLRCRILTKAKFFRVLQSDGQRKIEQFLKRVHRSYLGWDFLNTGVAMVRVSVEMLSLEDEAHNVFDELGFPLPRPPEENIASDEIEDWKGLIPSIKNHLCEEEFLNACRVLDEREGVEMMKSLQTILDVTTQYMPKDLCRNHVFRALNLLSRKFNRLVSIRVVAVEGDGTERNRGGFGSISKAQCDGQAVAVKAPIYGPGSDTETIRRTERAQKVLRREILLWRQLRHDNILPLIGVTNEKFPHIEMVAPWQENGHLLEYVDRSVSGSINRLDMLAQVCLALKFLHDHVPRVIHADLKCANVLVKQDGTPCLADFGLATVRQNGATLTSALDLETYGTVRWMAAELLEPESQSSNYDSDDDPDASDLKVTCFSDIWSFAMLALEFMTGNPPFHNVVFNLTVISCLQRGQNPEQPGLEAVRRGLSQELWEYLCRCWNRSLDKRPTLDSLYSVLRRLAGQWNPKPTDPATCDTVEIPISREVRRRINGSHGASIQTDLGVTFNVRGPVIVVSGVRENVEEAKARILNIADRQAKETEKTVTIPAHFHRVLIGKNGEKVKQFQRLHNVVVSFSNSEDLARVRGASDDVDKAIEELRQSVDVANAWNPSREIRASARLAGRLKAENLVESVGLGDMKIRPLGESRYLVILTGTPTLLDKAVDAINIIDQRLSDEAERTLTVPKDLLGLILGANRSRWSDMVGRCGGPEQRDLQDLMIDIDSLSGEIVLRGEVQVIENLAEEIRSIVEEHNRRYFGMHIESLYHGMLRRHLSAVQQSTKTQIFLPGHDAYPKLYSEFISSQPRSSSIAGDERSTVIIFGTLDNYERAKSELQTHLVEIRRRFCVLQIPLRFQNVTYNKIWHELLSSGVAISPSMERYLERPPVSPLSPASTKQWQIVERFDKHIEGTCEWTLRGSPECLDDAKNLIMEAIQKVQDADHIGFLALPDSSKFGLINGRQHDTRQNIERGTQTEIHVPRKDSSPDDTTIVITGTRQNVEKAKDQIIDLITPRQRARALTVQTTSLPPQREMFRSAK